MNCEQIRPYLPDFAGRSLPTYKIAWVAQHLAGCDVCRTLVRELEPAAVATAADATAPWEAAAPESGSIAVQRRVPGWVRLASLAGAVILLVTALAVVRMAGRRAAVPRARSGAAQPDTMLPPVATQSLMGTTLRLESVSRAGDEVTAIARFYGRELTVAPGSGTWLRVFGEHRQELLDVQTAVKTDSEGVAVEARFRLPEGQSRFLLRFEGVSQPSWQPWQVHLPDPFATVSPPGVVLGNSPAGVRLVSYRIDEHLLHVRLRFPTWTDTSRTPAFELVDAGDVRYAAVGTESALQGTERELLLRFPLPRVMQPPFSLVGSIPTRQQIGPWLLEGNMLK